MLLADHELNASTFAARVTASTGASLAAAVLAGLCALSGPRHGGMAARVEALADEAARRDWRRALAAGEPPPRLRPRAHPDGDPRATALLDAIEVAPDLAALRQEVEAATGRRANVDFALVALRRSLGLPAEASFALFALARTAGWLAHAIEQITTGALIRPRARYVGPPPVG